MTPTNPSKVILWNQIEPFSTSKKSNSIEDKAVDIYVFEKSLLCEKNSEQHFAKGIERFQEGYLSVNAQLTTVLNRLGNVKLRGRKKIAFG